jgi:hypothetical protein
MNNKVLYYIVSLVCLVYVYAQVEIRDYNWADHIPEKEYDVMANQENFETNNTCITMSELVEYNYTGPWLEWENWNKVFPQNFCYSMLTYNISRNDFADIVNKNLRTIFL